MKKQSKVAAPKITEASKAVFVAYAKDASNWSGEPLVGGNVGGTKEERGNLTQLKLAGLITTWSEPHPDSSQRGTLTWLKFTEAGEKYAASLGIELR